MTWETNASLPGYIRAVLPEAAQTRFRKTANDALPELGYVGAIKKGWQRVREDWERPAYNGTWVRKSAANIEGNLHIDSYLSDEEEEEEKKKLGKAQPRTLYVRRDVTNAEEIIAWAKAQGFETTLPADKMHVTILYSKNPVDWMAMGSSASSVHIPAGGPRLVEPLGDKGAIVLLFDSPELKIRHESMLAKGASSDFSGFQAHITITWELGGLDLTAVQSYQGVIELGPEIFEEIDEHWQESLTEKVGGSILKDDVSYTVAKVDQNLGLVFGWAIVCKVGGEDYYDLNIDKATGERVPEHIPESTMLECAADFMEHSRTAKEMHKGEPVGKFIFAFPLTTDIAKAMGIDTKVAGLMVAMKPSAETLKKFVDGTYKGFSICGSAIKVEDFSE